MPPTAHQLIPVNARLIPLKMAMQDHHQLEEHLFQLFYKRKEKRRISKMDV